MITKGSESDTSFSDSLLLISNLLKPPEDVFQFQIKLDRGDVLNWSIELLRPSQLRVMIEFIRELEEHLRMLYIQTLDLTCPDFLHYAVVSFV